MQQQEVWTPVFGRLSGLRRKIVRVISILPVLHQLAGPHRWIFYVSAALTTSVALIDGAVVVGAVPFIAHIVGSASGTETPLAEWLSAWIPDLKSERGIVLGIILLAAGVVIREGVSGFAKTTTYYATSLIVTHIRAQVATNLLAAKTAFVDTLAAGAPLQIVVSEARKGLQASRALISAFSNLVGCVLLTTILFNISVKLLVIMLAIAMAMAPLKYLYSLKLYRFCQTNLKASLALMDTLAETMRGLRQIKVQNRQDSFLGKIRGASQTSERVLLWANAMVANEPVLIHVVAITAIIGVLYGGHVTNLASLAEMSAFFFVLYRLLPLLASLSTQFNALLSAEPGITCLSELYHLDDSRKERTGGTPLTRPHVDRIELRDVHLTYTDGRHALCGVNMAVERGECIAIVGESGAGKSSILHVLLGLYEPKGEILIDGQNINGIDLRSLREKLRLVDQDVHLIRSRVDDFIAGNRSAANRDAVRLAAKMAAADEFINNLPKGFKSEVGTGAHALSGGERQRLAVAQAFAHSPPVLLLDEATSTLDSVTEQKVLDSLAAWREDRMVILVTHRVINLRYVDRIYTMKDGIIVEEGDWNTLIERNGEFARLVRNQMGAV